MSNALIKHVSDDSFAQDVLQSQTPVLLDFWADWCGPCKMIAPILDELATSYQGKLQIVKMDVTANPNTPAQFGVRGIPTLMIFKQGQLVATEVGAGNKAKISTFIDRNI